MMLPNTLFNVADLFVAAINGVWRWWSVGDVGDLTWVSDPLILLLRLLLFLLKITIYGSGLLILLAYAPSLPPLLSLSLLMACDDSDGLSVPKQVRSKFGLCASWRGKLAEFAAMASISKNEEGVRMEADTFLWLSIVDLLSAIDGVLRDDARLHNSYSCSIDSSRNSDFKWPSLPLYCLASMEATMPGFGVAHEGEKETYAKHYQCVMNSNYMYAGLKKIGNLTEQRRLNNSNGYPGKNLRKLQNQEITQGVRSSTRVGRLAKGRLHKVPVEPPDWNDEFKDPKLLLVVDMLERWKNEASS
ncbi:hypothetical protein Tco_0117810 [Tanacetum coccineum]